MVVGEFPTISETFVLNQITGLIDRGHDVTILADRLGRTDVVHPTIDQYGLLGRTRFINLPSSKLRRIGAAVPNFIKCFLRRPIITTKALNVRRYGAQARSLRLLFAMHALRSSNEFEVVHCHFRWNGVLACALREIGACTGKISVAFHALDVPSNPTRHDLTEFAFLRGRGNLFLPISERWRKRLLDLGLPSSKTLVQRMGVDVRSLARRVTRSARQICRSGEEPLSVVTVGRLVEKKGIHVGIAAIRESLNRFPMIQYTIVGDGPQRAILEEMIRSNGMTQYIHILGWRTGDEVKRILADADIVLVPSITASDGDQEGIPVVLMEAMACGVPVIASRHSAIPELVEDQVSGILVDEHDFEGIANAIQEIATNLSLAVTLTENARTTIMHEFNIDALNDELVRRFSRLIANDG